MEYTSQLELSVNMKISYADFDSMSEPIVSYASGFRMDMEESSVF
jgi:hypothetical protein